MKSTNFLIQEHKVILRALDLLDAIGASIEETGRVEQPDVDNVLDFIRWFADAHHQAKEERVLFPALKNAAASEDRHVDHMMLEHGQERALVEEMESDLRLADLPSFIACERRLTSTLRNHIYKEDRILFETVDSALSPAEDDACFEQLTRLDTDLDKNALQEKLKELRALEWKYLRR